MKTMLLALSMVLASTFALAAPALPKSKTPQPAYSGPRQFTQSVALSNGVAATVTVIADQVEEARVMGLISGALSDLARIDTNVNGNPDGELAKLSALTKGQGLVVSDELFDFLFKAKELADNTDGRFDICTNYRKLSLDTGTKTVTFKDDNMNLDTASLWPAYLVDAGLAKLTADGLTNVKVEVGNVSRNVGQDIYTPWKVSVNIPNPRSQNAYRSYQYSFSNKAVASLTNSVSVEDAGAAGNFSSVTVFGGDTMTASAYALAMYALGPKYAQAFADNHPEVKGIFVDGAGNLTSSRDLMISHPNYGAEDTAAPVPGVSGGPNDISQKKREEMAR